MPVKTFTRFKNWTPQISPLIKDKALATTFHERGYMIVSFLKDEEVSELVEFYKQEHNIKVEGGGMFYSLYSKDIKYREKIYLHTAKILKPALDKYFIGYKNIVNTYVNKVSGPESEFSTHQDTTSVDEFKYTALNVWIPLQDITLENGPLAVIEKTHWFFSPYRGISFPSPFKNILKTVRPYLKPLIVKAGEAIIFDARMIHNSMPNSSGRDRLAILCGVFPAEADFITCYKDSSKKESEIEVYKQDEKYILENETFYYNCHAKPTSGTLIGKIKDDFLEMDAETFEKLCAMNNVEKVKIIDGVQNIECKMIAEPDGINLPFELSTRSVEKPSLWQKMKTVFS